MSSARVAECTWAPAGADMCFRFGRVQFWQRREDEQITKKILARRETKTYFYGTKL